jgi:hypothetical protein
MIRHSEKTLDQLAKRFEVDTDFLMECLHESVIEVRGSRADLDLGNGTALRLRRLERICHTLNVEVPVAALLVELTQRIERLENAARLGKKQIKR